MGGAEEEEEKKEKIPHMCESIGHRPLQGRCPKGEQGRINSYPSRARVGRAVTEKVTGAFGQEQ